ncbi:MAG: hypothetical protein GF398_18815 [Chitinivibrionales bacterium]|nr:hypothetical protein [Chitinivibrionales bacterium]
MTDHRIKELLPDYIAANLPPDQAAAIDARLQASDELKREFESLKLYFATMQQLPAKKAPDNFLQSVNERIENESALKKIGNFLLRPFGIKIPLELAGLGVTVALLLLIINPFRQETADIVYSEVRKRPEPMVARRSPGTEKHQPASPVREEITPSEKTRQPERSRQDTRFKATSPAAPQASADDDVAKRTPANKKETAHKIESSQNVSMPQGDSETTQGISADPAESPKFAESLNRQTLSETKAAADETPTQPEVATFKDDVFGAAEMKDNRNPKQAQAAPPPAPASRPTASMPASPPSEQKASQHKLRRSAAGKKSRAPILEEADNELADREEKSTQKNEIIKKVEKIIRKYKIGRKKHVSAPPDHGRGTQHVYTFHVRADSLQKLKQAIAQVIAPDQLSLSIISTKDNTSLLKLSITPPE